MENRPVSQLKNKKILYILSGNEPSGFVRARIFKDELKQRGARVDYLQLKSDILIEAMFKSKPLLLLKLLFELLLQVNYNLQKYRLLKFVHKYDVVVAVKYVKSQLLSEIKSKSKALLIYDFDDSVWLRDFDGEEEFQRKIKTADCITSGNDYLARKAAQYNQNSFVVRAPSQIESFVEYYKETKIGAKSEKEIIIGWIGSASTLFSLYKVYDALEFIGSKYPNVVLKLLGTGKDRKAVPRFEKIKVITVPEYDQNEMIHHVSTFDIGVYPLFLSELSMGRGPLKATIYQAGKVPLICSGYIENNRFLEEKITGFFADETAEWIDKISFLVENPDARKQIGINGFNYALRNFSIENSVNQIEHALENCRIPA
ncbi:MAG: glycosyltransferase family 4 protein [Bacteroidales bacterium]